MHRDLINEAEMHKAQLSCMTISRIGIKNIQNNSWMDFRVIYMQMDMPHITVCRKGLP